MTKRNNQIIKRNNQIIKMNNQIFRIKWRESVQGWCASAVSVLKNFENEGKLAYQCE